MIQSFCRQLKKASSFFLSTTGKVKFVLLFTISMEVLAPSFLVKNLSITLDSLFSGFLAFIGFIFASRTFITFKLLESVYSQERYQKFIEKLQQDGAYSHELYAPLKKLDHELSVTTMMAFASMVLIVIFSFIDTPKIFEELNIHQIVIALFDNNVLDIYSKKLSLINLISLFSYKLFSDFTCAVIVATFMQLFINLRSMNYNIKAIIKNWEDVYKARNDNNQTSP